VKAFVENIVIKNQKQALCIGIYLVNREEWKFSVIHVRKEKDEVCIISSYENLDELESGENILNSDLPLILHIDGWGVLYKNKEVDYNSIPFNNPDFYIKEYNGPESKDTYYSIIRADLLKSVIDSCSLGSLSPSGLSFGPFNVGLIAPFLENSEKIKAGKWRLIMQDRQVNLLVSEGLDPFEQYQLGNELITSNLLPLYSSVIAFFSGEREENDLVKKSRDEFIYSRLIKYIGLGTLFVMMFILLLNFLLWSSLRRKNSELTMDIARNEQLILKLDEKKKEFKDKENLVAQYIGTSEKTHYSWLADRLSAIMPPGIRLGILDIQPLSKKPKAGVAIDYRIKEIIIEGDAVNLNEISGWVKTLNKESWVKKVELISFSTENEKDLGHFKLQIDF
jgi:hypothetical protein